MADSLRTLSLCTGIGGLDLGLAQVFRVRPVGYAERDAYAVSVLLERMEAADLEPAPIWIGDLRDLDARPMRGHVDLVLAGIPCQPWSRAGSQRGVDDERHLGDELLRIVREVGPTYVLVENVPGFASWDGAGHLLGALSQMGFDAEWTHVRAFDAGAPHLRERIFMLAYADEVGRGRRTGEWREGRRAEPADGGGVPDADRCDLRIEQRRGKSGSEAAGTRVDGEVGAPDGFTIPRWGHAPRSGAYKPFRKRGRKAARAAALAHAESERRGEGRPESARQQGGPNTPERGYEDVDHADRRRLEGERECCVLNSLRAALRNDADRCCGEGVSHADGERLVQRRWEQFDGRCEEAWNIHQWATEPDVGRVAHGVPDRVDRLRCLGNAVVPQQAALAFRELIAR